MADDKILKNNAVSAPDDLDLMLGDLAGELSPENEVADSVTPWRRAVRRIAIGLGLTLMQINYANLDLILPLIGVVLLLVGSRALRKANGGFKALFGAAVVMAVIRGIILVSAASCLRTLKGADVFYTVLSVASLIMNLWLLLAFRTGLADAMEKARTEQKTGWITAAILWYLIVLVLSFAGVASALVYLILAVYIVIIIALIVQAGKLDMAGYVLEPVPSKLSDLAFGSLYIGIIIVGIAVCGLFFSGLPMQWQARSTGRSTLTAQQAAQQLIELGVPENIVNDLGDEDLALMWGADRVLIQDPAGDADDPSLGGLFITHIAVRVPQQNSHESYKWRFIHHFSWSGSTRFGGIETIEMDALYRVTDDQGRMIDNTATDISGRVLMDRNGAGYEAPYYGHTLGRFSSDDPDNYRTGWLIEFRLDRTLFSAKFSFPKKAENARGYIMYAAMCNFDSNKYSSQMRYWHAGTFSYPYEDPSLQAGIIEFGHSMNRSEHAVFDTK